MTEAESKFIIDHIHEQLDVMEGDGADGNLDIIYDASSDGKTVEVSWLDDEGVEVIHTETYRIDVRLVAVPKEIRSG